MVTRRCCCGRRDVVTAAVVGMLIGVIFSSFTIRTLYTTSEKNKTTARNIVDRFNLYEVVHQINTSQSSNIITFKKNIARIASSIYSARKHVRGSKTSDFLQEALGLMDSVLSDLKLDKGTIYERRTISSKNVCPEEYKGSTYGNPFFYKGFEVTNCTYGKSLSKLVTVIKVYPEKTLDFAMQRFVDSVQQTYTGVKTVLGIRKSVLPKLSQSTNLSFVVMKPFRAKISDGDIIDQLLEYVPTPYVLIARNAAFLTNDSRLDRLIRELESMQLVVAAGASRLPNGHWSKGCFQSMHRNFTLKYMEGYDESLHECIFCDYVSAPFVVAKESLQMYELGDFDATAGLYEEWFLRLSTYNVETAVCADSMFHVEAVDSEEENYKKLLSHLKLYKLQTSEGKVFNGICKFPLPTSTGSRALSPCMLKSNAETVNTIMNVCENENMICELQSGTAVGAVKLGKVLPWERDGDVTFLSRNYTSFRSLQSIFSAYGYELKDIRSPTCCIDNRMKGGMIHVTSGRWRIEVIGQHMMDSELLLNEGVQPTKVLLDGNWVNVPRNPGLFVRNRYGREIYQHALHWMTTKSKTEWQPYVTNTFMPCNQPGSHDCLDRFNADGDLQFREFSP